jgi:hypothetical protein
LAFCSIATEFSKAFCILTGRSNQKYSVLKISQLAEVDVEIVARFVKMEDAQRCADETHFADSSNENEYVVKAAQPGISDDPALL